MSNITYTVFMLLKTLKTRRVPSRFLFGQNAASFLKFCKSVAHMLYSIHGDFASVRINSDRNLQKKEGKTTQIFDK